MTPDASNTTVERYLNVKEPLADRACYADSVEVWINQFGRDSFLFLDSSEYFTNPQAVLDEVFEFVNVSARQYEPAELQAQGRRRASRAASQGDRRTFWKDERMQECKQRLERLSGRKWSWGP